MKKAILGAAVVVLSRLAWPTPAPESKEPVAWTELRGATVSEGVLQAEAGAARVAGALSTRSIHSGDGYLEFSATGGGVACGLARHGHDAGNEEIDFGIGLGPEGRLSIIESGRVLETKRRYAPADRFRVGVEKGVVVFRQNGELLLASEASLRYPLRVQASIEPQGAGLKDAVLAGTLVENVLWVNGDETRSYGNDVARARGEARGSAVALSAQALLGDGLVEWRAADADLGAAVGLVSAGSAAEQEGLLDHGLLVRRGSLFVVEGATSPVAVGKVNSDDRLSVTVKGEAVEFRQNGRLVDESTLAAAGPLRVKALLEDLGASADAVVISGKTTLLVARPPTISVRSGHYADAQSVAVRPVDAGAVVTHTIDGALPGETDSNLGPDDTVLVANDTKLVAREWTGEGVGGVASLASYTIGPLTTEDVTWRPAEGGGSVSTRAMSSLDGAVEVAVGEGVGAGRIGLASAGGPDFTLELSGGQLFVNERGVRRAALGEMRSGDRLRVAVEGGLVRYRRNGRLLATSHVEPPLPLVARAAGAFAAASLSGRLEDAPEPPERSSGQLFLQLPAPVLSPAPATFVTSVTVSISAEPGATIHYTLDGVTEPDEQNSPQYSAPLVFTATTTLKAKAFHPDWDPSPTTTGTYTVKAATPVISPSGGTFSGVKRVTVTTATPGATIHYTLTGAEPQETDSAVGATGTVLLAWTATLKAKAFKVGTIASDTASADFTFPRLGSSCGGRLPQPGPEAGRHGVGLGSERQRPAGRRDGRTAQDSRAVGGRR